jgi:anti-anti-sigma factor
MRGELDFTVTQRLEEMFALVLGRHPRDVVLDMAEVTFVDCASARVIAAAAEALPGPGQLIIRPSSAAVRRLFEIVGLDVTIQSTQQHCLG